MKRPGPNASQLHQSNWKMSWVQRICGLMAILALAHVTYELSFSIKTAAPSTAAPEASQAAAEDKDLAKRCGNPRLPGRWEIDMSTPAAGAEGDTPNMPLSAGQALGLSRADTRSSARDLRGDPRAAGLVLPEKGAAMQGLVKSSSGRLQQSSMTMPIGGGSDLSADALRAQLREAARPMLSEQVSNRVCWLLPSIVVCPYLLSLLLAFYCAAQAGCGQHSRLALAALLTERRVAMACMLCKCMCGCLHARGRQICRCRRGWDSFS